MSWLHARSRSVLLARVGRAIYRARGAFGVPLFAAVLLAGRPAPYDFAWLEGLRSAVGWGLVMVGLFFRVWGVACWFTSDREGVLGAHRLMVADGPYVYLRNPRYLGNLLMGLGMGVLTGMQVVLVLYALLWSGVHFPIVAAERETLEARYGEAYAAYCARVPRFWPRYDSRHPLAGQLFLLNWPAALVEEMGTVTGWISLGLFVEWWRVAHLTGGWLAHGQYLLLIPAVLVTGEWLRRRTRTRKFNVTDRPLRP